MTGDTLYMLNLLDYEFQMATQARDLREAQPPTLWHRTRAVLPGERVIDGLARAIRGLRKAAR